MGIKIFSFVINMISIVLLSFVITTVLKTNGFESGEGMVIDFFIIWPMITKQIQELMS